MPGPARHLRAGDAVARIAPMPLDVQSARQAEAQLAAAQALERAVAGQFRQARASLDQDRRAASRVKALAAAGALAEREREEAELLVRLREDELATAAARVYAAAADVERARAALLALNGGESRAVVVVRAPADGCLLRISERSERVVAPGTPIAEVGDEGALELVVDVLSSDATRIRAGAPVLVERWGGAEELSGRVRIIEPAAFTRVSALGVEEQRVNVVVDLPAVPPTLGDGYRLEARIVVWDGARVLAVPASALFRVGEEWAVFAIEDGRAMLRQVRIGEQGETEVQVLSGLEAGEQVIVFPSDQIRTGVRVAMRR